MDSYNKGYIDGLKKAADLFKTHEEGFGGYCDTGADMDWWCRSDCTKHGIERLRKHYTQFINKIKEK